ncbi:MAG: F0F1 ATP synthase subunit A [Thermodesulfovibrionales bacterium]|nr:F0F1 ATP synthase subunit A [Thermodesulfovibrionales bacterium]
MTEPTLMDIVVNPQVVPPFVSFAFLGSFILIGVSLAVRGTLQLVPRGMQNVVETFVEGMVNLSEENIGHRWGERLSPLIGTLFMYILLCNFMGLIPGFASPTANINMNASMAIPVFFATHYYGLRAHGLGYFKHFMGPIRSVAALPLMMLMFVIEGIGHLVRPLTLSVRLFGNMLAKHIILMVLAMLTPWIVPTLILALGTLVSLIQAFVFTLLATLYLAGAVEEGH